MSDINFWDEKVETMKLRHRLNLYPPQFELLIDGSRATGDCFLEIKFSGDIKPNVLNRVLYLHSSNISHSGKSISGL